jgi:hypothetical protein
MLRTGRVLVSLLVAGGLFGACTSVTVGPGATRPPATELVLPDDTPAHGPAGGSWTGTITLRAIIDVNEEKDGDNDLDPNSAYYATYHKTRTNQLDVTDTFTVSADDPESVEYGISGVTLDGPAANTGSTDVSEVYLWDKQNSGCTWKEHSGHEMSGSWNGSGKVDGSLEFQEDGSYTVFLSVTDASDAPTLQMHSWLENSDISANCEEVEPGYDTTEEAGPQFVWTTDRYGDTTTDGGSVVIEGTVGQNSTVVEGSKTWEIGSSFPGLEVDPINVTATWHLEHSGPITLPHD